MTHDTDDEPAPCEYPTGQCPVCAGNHDATACPHGTALTLIDTDR